MKLPFLIASFCLFFIKNVSAVADPEWTWVCQNNFCQKTRTTNDTKSSAMSLPACQLFCGEFGRLWPKPTGAYYVGNFLVHINSNSIDIIGPQSSQISDLIADAKKRFLDQLRNLVPPGVSVSGGRSLVVDLNITDVTINRLTLQTKEDYTLKISETSDGRINAVITADNYFGARHGLETLNQLIIFDDIRDELQIVRDAIIIDGPVYPHRGLLLDTSRNYISIDAIKRTIEGMALSKLNSFHWHLTDTHSFPFVSKSRPQLSKIGAYNQRQIYTPEVIEDLVHFARVRGVKIIPEFDAPAHVGEGWQDTGFVACLNRKPWGTYCVEPPCGQIDPTQDGVYDVLEDIYGDMVELFDPDVFHMGGDEVNLNCWNSTENIVRWMQQEKSWNLEESDFMKLWDVFQSNALSRLYKRTKSNIPIILWTSTLTEAQYVDTYLPNDTYIIQIWTTGTDSIVSELLDKNYRLIISNYDALYFDCGFAGWVGGGNNWCSPYIGWQKVYENSPADIAGDKKDQILGGEAALWSEQVDSSSVDGRFWPRAAALGERLWAEPITTWREAEMRMLVQRERLVSQGIQADALEPQWCLQNEESCPSDGIFNRILN